jgi:hypothetical protein
MVPPRMPMSMQQVNMMRTMPPMGMPMHMMGGYPMNMPPYGMMQPPGYGMPWGYPMAPRPMMPHMPSLKSDCTVNRSLGRTNPFANQTLPPKTPFRERDKMP